MYYFGIDVHKGFLVICIMDANRGIIKRIRIRTSEPDRLRRLLESYTPAKAVIEASGLSQWLLDFLKPLVEQVLLAHPGKLKVICDTVKKTDKVDAAILAELLVLDFIPRAYIATAQEREDRSLLGNYRYLGREIKRAKQRIRSALLRRNWQEFPASKLYTKKGLEWLLSLPWSVCERLEIDVALAILDTACKHQNDLRKRIESRACEEAACRRYQTAPGIGPLTALAMMAILGELSRFKSVHKVSAFVGLVPRVDQSSDNCYLGHISRKGNGFLRGLLIEAAWKAIRSCPHLRAVFERIAKKRGRKIAIVGIARRLLIICMSMMRDKTVYGARDIVVEEVDSSPVKRTNKRGGSAPKPPGFTASSPKPRGGAKQKAAA